MELTAAVALLERNGQAIITFLDGVEPSLAVWKPSPDKWSPLDVACHLLDEERDDFRARIRLTLENQPWPGIDPEAWVVEHDYASRDMKETLDQLRRERAESVLWLRGSEIDLDAGHEHPRIGRLRVGDLLVSWVAHDLLHLRQLTRLQFQWMEQDASPYSPRYAGSW